MPHISTRQLILVAVLAIFVYGVIASMLGTIMPTFKLTEEQNGNIALAQALGLVIASLSVGPLIDARGKKAALVVGLAIITAALFSLPHADGAGQIMAVLFGLGFGGGTIVTAANSLASDIGESRRATALNLLNLFFGLGGLATPFIAANFLSENAVALCYLAAVLTAIAFLLTIATRMPAPTGEQSFKASEATRLLGRPSLYLLALYLFLYVSCEVGVWNWLAKYLIGRGIPEKNALNILSLGFALGLLVGRVVVSRIVINVSSINVTLASSALMAVTTYLMLHTSDPTVAWVAVFCAGLSMAPVFPTTLAIVGDVFPRMTATAFGIVITCGWIGLAVSSRIIGSIANSSGLGSALLLIPAFSVAMVLVNIALRPTLKKA